MTTQRSLSEAMGSVLNAALGDLHVALPGTVRSYDSASQTAEIELGARRVIPADDPDEAEDTTEDLPILQSVPVAWPRAGGFFLHFPLAAGDAVLVVFSEVDTGAWRESGGVTDPSMSARHGLSGAVAIPGMFTRSDPVGSADGTYGRIGADGGSYVEFRASEIHAGGTAALALATETKARLDQLQSAFDTHKHTGVTTGGGTSGTTDTVVGPLAGIASSTLKGA